MSLQQDIARVSVRSMADIRPAADALHAMVNRCGTPFKIALSDNISSKRPLVDADGALPDQALQDFQTNSFVRNRAWIKKRNDYSHSTI